MSDVDPETSEVVDEDEEESPAEKARRERREIRAKQREEVRHIIQRLDRENDGVVGAPTAEVFEEAVEDMGSLSALDAVQGLCVRGQAYCPSRTTIRLVDPLDDAADDEPKLVTDGGEPDGGEDVDVWEDGILIADGGTSTLDGFTPDTPEDGRPNDCVCWDATLDLPCWPCYREGFDTQNPAEPGADDGGDVDE
ncbi:hypothetical protein [Halocalculus aciditolerans]|uniref:Uncharacterized protein n=1 Tax=Halocalculus aciditolerans TaxID=1383812 RepID=A0A830FB75_9EURY|nr:hypothetical protein [Halocalculus aciditolerans]GGL57779.1 hypothetical protein GCM10009039_14940 [Halocalculus aciditolerans]